MSTSHRLSMRLLTGVLLASIAAPPASAQTLPTYPSTGYPDASSPAPYVDAKVPGADSAYSNSAEAGLRAPALGGDYRQTDPAAGGTTSAGSFPPQTTPRGIDTAATTRHFATAPATAGAPYYSPECWGLQLLPDGLLYPAYLAGGREPRLASQWVHIRDHGWVWDSTLGARVGLLRYGPLDDPWPDGWQLDVEGAVFPRLDLELEREMVAADYRAGVPWTFRRGPWEGKFAYYHLSAHLGDEYTRTHPDVPRINYVRDCVVAGIALRPFRDLRLYSEVGYAVYTDGGARPWEFQFGVEYSPVEPSGPRGTPFLAVNSHLRQDNDFSGNVSLQTGWQWRGQSGHLLRVGFHYLNGMSDFYQFFTKPEDQVGVGLWYDF